MYSVFTTTGAYKARYTRTPFRFHARRVAARLAKNKVLYDAVTVETKDGTIDTVHVLRKYSCDVPVSIITSLAPGACIDFPIGGLTH